MSDEFELEGETFTWRTQSDSEMSIFDEDACMWGKLEWSSKRNAYEHYCRPEGFNGNSEILDRSYGSVLWWQPRDDAPKRGTEEFRKERSTVKDLIEYGYVGVVVEHEESGESGSLWGIEAMEYDYHETVAKELAAEILYRIRAEQANAQWAIDHGIETVR